VSVLLGALRRANVPLAKVAFHFHDTYGQALANVLAAMTEGITTFDASVGGIGGSPFAKVAGGNLGTEDLVWVCNRMGMETGLARGRPCGDEQLYLPGELARANGASAEV